MSSPSRDGEINVDFMSLIAFMFKGAAILALGSAVGILTMALMKLAKHLPQWLKNVAPTLMACAVVIAVFNTMFIDNVTLIIAKSSMLLIFLYSILGAAGIFIMLLFFTVCGNGIFRKEHVMFTVREYDIAVKEADDIKTSYFSISPVLIS